MLSSASIFSFSDKDSSCFTSAPSPAFSKNDEVVPVWENVEPEENAAKPKLVNPLPNTYIM